MSCARCKFAVIVLLVVAMGLAGCQALRRPEVGPEPSIKVYVDGQVKALKIETYLEGVVAGEMDPTWPVQALAAQAIVARTFTLKKVMEGGGFDRFVASTDEKRLQAYSPKDITENVRDAIAATRGMVVTYQGEVAKTWFHSCSGGMTAAPREGLNYPENPPYVGPVEDSFSCDDRDRWQATFTVQEVREAASKVRGVPLSSLDSISIADKGPSGRAIRIQLGAHSVHAADFRVALDPERMGSTLLTELALDSKQVHMAGRGFGHGVGMSQYGARAQAQQGKTAQEIINYYFQGVGIERRWK